MTVALRLMSPAVNHCDLGSSGESCLFPGVTTAFKGVQAVDYCVKLKPF